MQYIKIPISAEKITLENYPSFIPKTYPLLVAIEKSNPTAYVLYYGTKMFVYLGNFASLNNNLVTDIQETQQVEGITSITLLKALAILQDPSLAIKLCK